jgi:hypothetical protein
LIVGGEPDRLDTIFMFEGKFECHLENFCLHWP